MNGQEVDDEFSKIDNSNYTATFWEFNARIARRFNLDIIDKQFESSYSAFMNNPVWFVDPDGADTTISNNKSGNVIIRFNPDKSPIDYKAQTDQKLFDFIEVSSMKNINERLASYAKENKLEINTVVLTGHGCGQGIYLGEHDKFIDASDIKKFRTGGSTNLVKQDDYLNGLLDICQYLPNKTGNLIITACRAGNGDLPLEIGGLLMKDRNHSFNLYMNKDQTRLDYSNNGFLWMQTKYYTAFNVSLAKEFNNGWTYVSMFHGIMKQINLKYSIGLNGKKGNSLLYYKH